MAVKFKRRKKAAQKNLENERANLVRINDILSELENTADYIGIIANGQIQREAAIKDIHENFPSGLEEYFFEAMRGDKTE